MPNNYSIINSSVSDRAFLNHSEIGFSHKRKTRDLAGVAQWTECQPVNQSVTDSIPSQGTAWVASQVPSKGHERGNHTFMFLSLSPSHPLSLKINK